MFETCLVKDSKIINFSSHLERIKTALSILKFNINFDELCQRSNDLLKKNNLQDGLLRISISRGVGSSGYLPKNITNNLVIIQTKDPILLPKSLNLIVSDYVAGNYSFKSLNSLPYVLAKIYAAENKYYDAIMIDKEGYISETSSANIFWVKKDAIFTPSDDCCLVKGTIRKKLLEIPQIKIVQGKFGCKDLEEADEVFITNSAITLKSIDKIAFRNKKNIYEIKYNKKLVKKVSKLLKMSLGLD